MPNGTDHPTLPPTPATITHANGTTFRIIDGNSHYARVARQVRQLTMADGSTWTVGLPIGWRGQEAAWHPVETAQQHAARISAYGASIERRDRRQLGLHITGTPAANFTTCPECGANWRPGHVCKGGPR